MVKHSTPDVVCMKTSKVSNIITQLTRAMEIQENADHTNDSHGCDSLQFAVNYTNQVLLDCIADLKRDLDMHELTFRDYQYDLWNLIYSTFLLVSFSLVSFEEHLRLIGMKEIRDYLMNYAKLTQTIVSSNQFNNCHNL